MLQIWTDCIDHLRGEIPPADIHTWLAPLHPVRRDNTLKLLAPNRYVRDYVRKNFLIPIQNAFTGMDNGISLVRVEIGTHGVEPAAVNGSGNGNGSASNGHSSTLINGNGNGASHTNGTSPYAVGIIHPDHTFEKHVEGSSNQVARAAALQVGQNSGHSYNPLFIYGGVGLGKTHLMHAAGHLMRESNPASSVLYVRSEIFVNDMVKALKSNRMHDFKRHYRSPAALLIDDIQFFARKTQSQEEFFHTFNTLLEGQRQIIITSDRIPNAITDVDTRLISRFSYGLTVAIDPPELETRVAILERKALEQGVTLPNDVAFFVAGAIRSNVRALAGALHRILANARFTGRAIDVALAREALRDLLAHQERQLSVENIQQTVADYYNLRVADLLSRKRTRHIARPRQLAMYLAKEYTNLSLPQIGDRFGGRDHTTVLHACRKITDLSQSDPKVREDCRNLQRVIGV